eukprot:4281414-Prymnesium_polylepis.1
MPPKLPRMLVIGSLPPTTVSPPVSPPASPPVCHRRLLTAFASTRRTPVCRRGAPTLGKAKQRAAEENGGTSNCSGKISC